MLKNLSATEILREINVGYFRSSKIEILINLMAMNVHLGYKISKNCQLQYVHIETSVPLKLHSKNCKKMISRKI